MSAPSDLNVVMLIDDDLGDQKLYRRILARSGIEVDAHYFDYASEALAFLAGPDRPSIDLIFLDINMPGMDGFEFLEAASRDLGACFDDIVVVMLTTSTQPSDRERAFTFSAVRDYFHKPLTVENVKTAVDHVHALRASRSDTARVTG